MAKNLPSNAGDVGLIPGQGTKVPHATGQLSPHATTTEPTPPGDCTSQLERENPHATTREEPEPHNEETSRCNERSRMPQQRSRVPQLRPNAAQK